MTFAGAVLDRKFGSECFFFKRAYSWVYILLSSVFEDTQQGFDL